MFLWFRSLNGLRLVSEVGDVGCVKLGDVDSKFLKIPKKMEGLDLVNMMILAGG